MRDIAEDYSQVVNLKKEVGLIDQRIVDVALGYLHTMVLVE